MIAGLPDAVMLRFFRRLYRYNKLIEMDKKNPVPTHIIDNEKEMIEKSTEELKEFGIQDADAFFLRSEVQASYVMFCVEEKLQDESYEHCCRCKKFLYRPPTVRCSLPHHPFDLYCKDFVDTGLAYHQRLTLHLARCGICKNITEDQEQGVKVLTCKLKGTNHFDEECGHFEAHIVIAFCPGWREEKIKPPNSRCIKLTENYINRNEDYVEYR